jgi:hypothetical protein
MIVRNSRRKLMDLAEYFRNLPKEFMRELHLDEFGEAIPQARELMERIVDPVRENPAPVLDEIIAWENAAE